MTEPRASARRDLPTDPDGLVSMGQAFEMALDEGLGELGLRDGPAGTALARRTYEAHARLLREWNAAISLTAIRDPAEVARRHVCDSLSAVPTLLGLDRTSVSLLDIGSGGGYPGLPLAAALPLARIGLLDSVGKKARFLAVAGTAVATILSDRDGGPPAIEAIAERAEDVAEEPDQRGAWDVVVARAVGSLAEVIELGLPLASPGGVVLAWKRDEGDGGLQAELRDAGSIIRAAGGGKPVLVGIDAASLPGHQLVVITKERPTPASYPRPAGVRKRRRR